MFHPEREIRDRDIIKAILDMCEVIDIGFFDDEFPYILPVNFGYEFEDDLVFYTHHALEGYKNTLVAKNPKVCVVTYKFMGHIYNSFDHSSHDYRSVMAFGEMSFIQKDSEDYKRAWDALAKGYNHSVPDIVYSKDFNILMGKIVCRPENVVAKAQRQITSPDQVPLRSDPR